MLKVLRRPLGLILFFKKREKRCILNSTPSETLLFFGFIIRGQRSETLNSIYLEDKREGFILNSTFLESCFAFWILFFKTRELNINFPLRRERGIYSKFHPNLVMFLYLFFGFAFVFCCVFCFFYFFESSASIVLLSTCAASASTCAVGKHFAA